MEPLISNEQQDKFIRSINGNKFHPFVAFGDFATNVWFITDLILKKIHREIDSTTVLELAAIAFIAQLQVGLWKSCCDSDRCLLPQKFFVKLFYRFCYILGAPGFFLFMYQRCACFGPRYSQFEQIFQRKQANIGLCFVNTFVYFAMLGSQIAGIAFYGVSIFDYFNIGLTGIMVLYYFFLIPYFWGLYKESIRNHQRRCCYCICQSVEKVGDKIQNKLFSCCPKRQFSPLSQQLIYLLKFLKISVNRNKVNLQKQTLQKTYKNKKKLSMQKTEQIINQNQNQQMI